MASYPGRRRRIQILPLTILVVVIAVLLVSLLRLQKKDYSVLSDRMAQKTRDEFHVMKPCPLCGTLLKKGERVHTVVYSKSAGDGKNEGAVRNTDRERPKDSIVHMFGCPYCYPANDEHRRVCPVCHDVIADDGYVVARMFEKKPRNHVHVLGCTGCRTVR